jgi:quercetin dioxygenase-like cupin family protein
MPSSRRAAPVLCLAAASLATPAAAQSVRVVRFEESAPFKMGSVTARRIIHPGLGAKRTTLNFSVSEPGAEFAQHVHDISTDTILVLEGEVNLRQGDKLMPLKAGQSAYIPAGQVHGTITAGKGPAVMISFQNPPDLALYSGERDSSRAGAAAPQGAITPGAVKVIDFRGRNGRFLGREQGADAVAAYHLRLGPGQEFKARVAEGAEGLFFVWRGAIRVTAAGAEHTAGERDTVFIQGQATLVAASAGADAAEVIHVHAPAGKKED